MTLLRLPFVFLLLFSSCILPPEPNSKIRVDRSWGFAGAASTHEAEELASVVEDVLPELSELGGFRARSLRIHLSEELGNPRIEGITVESGFGDAWIAVRRGRESLKNTVAHEMVHFYFDGVLSRFSNVFQEGLAEYMAGELYPDPKRRKRMLVFVAASYLDNFTIEVQTESGREHLPYLVQPVPSVEELFELDWYDHLTSEPRVSETLYGLGLLMAERIGWDGMVELVERADREGLNHVPGEWVRSAAGLEPPTVAKVRAAVLDALEIKNSNGNGNFRIILK